MSVDDVSPRRGGPQDAPTLLSSFDVVIGIHKFFGTAIPPPPFHCRKHILLVCKSAQTPNFNAQEDTLVYL